MRTIENIKVGDYIAVTSEDYQHEKIIPKGFEYEYREAISPILVEPVRVTAVSAPFLICERVGEQEGICTLDVRFQDLTKVDRRFVREFCRLKKLDTPKDVMTAKQSEDEKEADKKTCPLCCEQMSERMSERTHKKKWILVCNRCEMQYVPLN